MSQLHGPKNNFWLLTADNASALTVSISSSDESILKYSLCLRASRIPQKLASQDLYIEIEHSPSLCLVPLYHVELQKWDKSQDQLGAVN